VIRALEPVETEIGRISDPRERLLAFARERHSIYLRRKKLRPFGQIVGPDIPDDDSQLSRPGKKVVWTADPILQQYRFCNVYRELDRVTVWVRENWREPHCDDPDLWFAMLVARFVNWPETLEQLGYPVPWNPIRFLTTMALRKRNKVKSYGGAYMIRADSGTPGRGTAEYQEAAMFTPFWGQRESLRPKGGDTLNSYHMLLGQLYGLGSFMAAQIVADLMYAPSLLKAEDWWTFAASGPGSRRGLNRVLGRPVKSPWAEEEWRMELGRLRDWFNERWPFDIGGGVDVLHAQDVQNVLCEFDKYERVRLGEGRPRARFP
jgi:hypothetical protein